MSSVDLTAPRRGLNLADIQGNVLLPYGKQGFPYARYVFLRVDPHKEEGARKFLTLLLPKITSALPWDSKIAFPDEVLEPRPAVAWNLAFTFRGLYALGLPTTTLRAMPAEFIDGMAARAHILGDRPERDRGEEQAAVPPHWDAIWRHAATRTGEPSTGQVHMLLSLNAGFDPKRLAPDRANLSSLLAEARASLEAAYADLVGRCEAAGGAVQIVPGHGPDRLPYQDAAAVCDANGPSKREHFGFADGFGDPVFHGQYPAGVIAERAIGQGKLKPDQSWAPLATGEFLLGYVDEAQEIPGQTYPFEFTRNGTFMAYRKLHENLGAFDRWVETTARAFARHLGLDPDADLPRARQTLMAKLAGRWPDDGVPLSVAPTWDAYQAFRQRETAVGARLKADPDDRAAAAEKAAIRRQYVDFTFADDLAGHKCPVAAHLRRVNPRDALDPKLGTRDRMGSALNNRRRILRRGLPYGDPDNAARDDAGEHGIIFMAICASLFRQFEFVQQQWLQYGLDFNVGNDTCPLLGNHGPDAKIVIPADPGSDRPPFIAARIPQLVEVRGGDYFFIPSLTGLRMLALGIVDPT